MNFEAFKRGINFQQLCLPIISILSALFSALVKAWCDRISRINLDVFQLKNNLELFSKSNAEIENLIYILLYRSTNFFNQMTTAHLMLAGVSLLLVVFTVFSSRISIYIKIVTVVIVLWLSIFLWLFDKIS
ncbi:hypothetical protein [Microbulbifer sp. TYP-18]|uniref:hypothetical protein n=1 Tax=Microbulbifer sp. TYP-18 TaxID=3230024 RepID=UPI0034C5EE52